MTSIRKLFDRAYVAARERSYTRGILGDADGNLLSATRPDFVRVRVSQEGRQSVTLARHLGRVPMRAGLPVRMTFENNVYVIEGVDSFYYDSATASDTPNNYGLPAHSHALDSGLTYLIEAQRMQPGLVRPGGGWTVTIEPARYNNAGTWETYAGETLSLLGNRPSTTGKHRLVIITIDPATNLTSIVNGSDQDYATTLTQADIDAVSIGDKIPLAAVLMRADDTTINIQARFIDARGWLNQGGGGASTLDGLSDVVITTPTTGDIITRGGGGDWINAPYPTIPQNFEDLADVSFTALADGDLVAYDAGLNDWVNIDPASLSPTPALITDWSFRDNATFSTSSFAWKGNRFTPDKDVDIYAICYFGTIVANGVYQAAVITGTGSPGNVDTATKSATHTVGGSPASTAGGYIWLEFATPVSLTAGTVYGLMVGRTDGGNTYQLPILANGGTGANKAVPMPGLSHGTLWRVADAALTVGATIDVQTGNSAGQGFRFRFPDSNY